MEAFERRAYRTFGIVIDEEEFIQRFELRHAAIMMNIELRMAIQAFIETKKGNGELDHYINEHMHYFKEHRVPKNEVGIYGGTARLIYLLAFGRGKSDISEIFGTKYYESLRDHFDTQQLQLITTIEQMAANRIINHQSGPIEAVKEVVDFMGLSPELPRAGHRITSLDVRKVIAKKSR